MKSETVPVQQVFQDRRQYLVPFYQRAYVWNKDEQWEPLWNDIADKAEMRSKGDTPSPHFLGAIVLEPQPRRGLRGVETYHIIDGQQRLTTLQYLLAAIAIAARETGQTALLHLIDGCVWNPNPETMENADVERFKVWPTFRDRIPYQTAMESQDRDDLRSNFPSSFTQTASLRRVGIEHPQAMEAIWYFREKIDTWLVEDDAGGSKSLEQIAEAVLRDLRLVSISLDDGDDAQVIFETLNGRGAELHATDLIRNFIFMRADKDNADGSALYDALWSPFEGSFWNEEQRRGRLKKPRLEWFLQSALQAELADNVDIGKLYADYRKFGMGQRTPVPAERQLQMLTAYAEHYRQFTSGSGSDPIALFGKRMANWDASPTHSLALRVASMGLSPSDQTSIFGDIMSYLVRRAVCGLTPKNYNNVFVQLLKKFKDGDATPLAFRTTLATLDGAASRWPRDEEFRNAWMTESAHARLGDIGRIRTIFSEIENGLRSPRAEEPFVMPQGLLDVDHIMPDKWYEHWPLGGEPVTAEEAGAASLAALFGEKQTPRGEAISKRERLKATFGNLTLVHYGINRSLQHGPFNAKRETLFAESNLHLNRDLMRADHWDEETITQRGRALFEIANRIWRGPERVAA
jgi:hypothetical protein